MSKPLEANVLSANQSQTLLHACVEDFGNNLNILIFMKSINHDGKNMY